MTRALRAAPLAALLVALAGCGGGPALTAVEGTVTGPDGKPLPDVLVQFNPDQNSGAKVLGSSAVSDANGRYVLKSDDGQDGAVVGPHRVVLIDNAFAGGDDDADLGKKDRKEPKKRVNRVPASYLSATTTPLQVVVDRDKKTYDLKIDRRP